MAPKIVIAAVVVAGLLGCASLAPPPPPPGARVNCGTSGECTVLVHVEGCTLTAGDIDIYTATNIFWELDRKSRDDGWSFPDELVQKGIWIKDPPQGQFDSPDRQSDWRYKLHDKNEVKGTFRYGVRVWKNPIMCELDPAIVNH